MLDNKQTAVKMLSRYNFIKLNRIFSVNVPIGGHYSATRSASQLNKSKIQDIEDFAKVFRKFTVSQFYCALSSSSFNFFFSIFRINK